MTRIILASVVSLIAWGSLAPQAFAHRLSIDARFTAGAAIEGEAFFDDGAPARRARVSLLLGEAVLAAEREVDAEGRFRFLLDEGALARARAEGGVVTVVVRDSAGHRSQASVALGGTEREGGVSFGHSSTGFVPTQHDDTFQTRRGPSSRRHARAATLVVAAIGTLAFVYLRLRRRGGETSGGGGGLRPGGPGEPGAPS